MHKRKIKKKKISKKEKLDKNWKIRYKKMKEKTEWSN